MANTDLVINSVSMIDFEGATGNPSVVLYRKDKRPVIGGKYSSMTCGRE